MKIQINDHRKILAIQKEFSTLFPWLKIEFFNKPHKVKGGSPLSQLVSSSKTLGECRTVHNSGVITIVPGMTVADLEQSFRDVYGLSIQIFRKSGKTWLETTVTDTWTLEKQNQQGQLLSQSV